MSANQRILIAVDSSPSSRHAVEYVADYVGNKPDWHVGLIHFQAAPQMLEWGGSERPEIEEKISEERKQSYRQLEKESVANGKNFLREYQSTLTQKKIDVAALIVKIEDPLESSAVATDIIKTARDKNYGTVVVGRDSYPELKGIFHRAVADQVAADSDGLAIWLVE